MNTDARVDRTREFVDEITDLAFDLADRTIATAKAALAHVKARDTMKLAGIDPAHVHLSNAQWTQAEKMISFQVACLRGER